MKLKVLCVIPARIGSTRLPRKMLASIAGKPLIFYPWRQAKKAKRVDEVIVATDSQEIAKAVKECGGEAMLTSIRHKTGSDRVAEAARRFKKFRPDIVVNVQGDQPLVSPLAIDRVVEEMIKEPEILMATVGMPLRDMRELKNPNIVKEVLDKYNNALYFSRSPIPYERTKGVRYYTKLGLYGFRYDFLQQYVKLPQTPLEIAESLEQLRALEHGFKVRVVIGNFKQVEVNDAQQLAQARKIILGKKNRSRR